MQAKVRDPVHQFIALRDKELRLLATPVLQRLRGIRQLAMASLVYPGAVHTRFEHSLGVMHVAGLMAEALEFDQDGVELVRLAGLLHDIGHGPFSHVSELALERYADRTSLRPEQKREKIHELITTHLLRCHDSLNKCLGKPMCERIADLLSGRHGDRGLQGVVSGPLDADKQDYLLRDSYFCGVPYGLYDIHQLHRSLVLVGPEDDKEIMIRPDGVHALEQYVLAKYYLTTNVYRHKVRLVTDQMLHRAVVLGVEQDHIQTLRELFAFDNTSTFVQNYLQWDDARFLEEFGRRSPDTRCGKMLGRLRARDLPKRVFRARVRDMAAEARESLLRLGSAANRPRRTETESEIAEQVTRLTQQEIDEDAVIVHAYGIKSVRETSRNDESSINVATTPAPKKFEDESFLFATLQEGYVDEFVEVYAPVRWDNPAQKKKTRHALEEPIRVILNSCRLPVQGGEQ